MGVRLVESSGRLSLGDVWYLRLEEEEVETERSVGVEMLEL